MAMMCPFLGLLASLSEEPRRARWSGGATGSGRPGGHLVRLVGVGRLKALMSGGVVGASPKRPSCRRHACGVTGRVRIGPPEAAKAPGEPLKSERAEPRRVRWSGGATGSGRPGGHSVRLIGVVCFKALVSGGVSGALPKRPPGGGRALPGVPPGWGLADGFRGARAGA